MAEYVSRMKSVILVVASLKVSKLSLQASRCRPTNILDASSPNISSIFHPFPSPASQSSIIRLTDSHDVFRDSQSTSSFSEDRHVWSASEIERKSAAYAEFEERDCVTIIPESNQVVNLSNSFDCSFSQCTEASSIGPERSESSYWCFFFRFSRSRVQQWNTNKQDILADCEDQPKRNPNRFSNPWQKNAVRPFSYSSKVEQHAL